MEREVNHMQIGKRGNTHACRSMHTKGHHLTFAGPQGLSKRLCHLEGHPSGQENKRAAMSLTPTVKLTTSGEIGDTEEVPVLLLWRREVPMLWTPSMRVPCADGGTPTQVKIQDTEVCKTHGCSSSTHAPLLLIICLNMYLSSAVEASL